MAKKQPPKARPRARFAGEPRPPIAAPCVVPAHHVAPPAEQADTDDKAGE